MSIRVRHLTPFDYERMRWDRTTRFVIVIYYESRNTTSAYVMFDAVDVPRHKNAVSNLSFGPCLANTIALLREIEIWHRISKGEL